MKLKIRKAELDEGLKNALRGVSRNVTLDFLKCLRLEAKDGKAILTGTNLESGIEFKGDADVQETGVIIFDGFIMQKYIKTLQDGDTIISLVSNEKDVEVFVNSTSEIKLPLVKADFPDVFPKLSENVYEFHLKREEFVRLFSSTVFACSNDDNRPTLTGCFLDIKEDGITSVGCDGFRVAISTINGAFGIPQQLIIPAASVSEVLKIVSGEVNMSVSSQNIIFKIGDKIRVFSRIIEGPYSINYNTFLTLESDITVKAIKEEFQQCISRASLFCADSKKHPIVFHVCKDDFVVTVNSEIGSFKENIRVDHEGGNVDTGFNPQYFEEGLPHILDENITMEIKNSISPCMVKGDNDSFRYVVLPVRLQPAS